MSDSTLRQRLLRAEEQLNEVICGKREIVRMVLTCLLARGHVLLEDLPGAGKTTLAKALAATLGLQFRRVQFTADMLPADMIGFTVPDVQRQKLLFHRGPLFTQLLLADEINRASPRSQSALLEAMEERQVTTDQKTYALDSTFFVIATQNPLDQSGTFALPESQLDRFLMRLSPGYPDAASEVAVLSGVARSQLIAGLQAVLSHEDVLALQAQVMQVHVSLSLAKYVQRLLQMSRQSGVFRYGLSTRAGLALVQAARAFALLDGEDAVLPRHVQAVFAAVAEHRLHLARHDADAAQLCQAVSDLLNQVSVPL